MCLYPNKIRNPHYLINEKNGGKPPVVDKTKEYIYANCGWCIECRKKIATEWRIRLYEELKYNRNASFVTLTFTPESIKELEEKIIKNNVRGLKEGEIDVNILASYAVRLFTERWRKKYKKAPKHWLITELGHKNSERIHLHGIIWNEGEEKQENIDKEITKHWKYGNVFIGSYVNEKTINYICKYVTKLDKDHKGYKQKIITSKGIGKNYLTNNTTNKFNEELTNKKYRATTGVMLELPKYYKNKLWTEEERSKLWDYSIEKGEIYISKNKYELTNQDDMDYRNKFINDLETSRNFNELIGYGSNKSVNEKYIITEAMKISKLEMEIGNIVKLVKKKPRRKIKEEIAYEEIKVNDYEGLGNINSEKRAKKIDTEDLNKSMNLEKYIYGEYIGNLTTAEENYNKLLQMAEKEGLTVRAMRLKLKGLPYK